MTKIGALERADGGKDLYFLCPGCNGMIHVFGSLWKFNGDMNKPTLSPSYKTWYPFWVDGMKKEVVCHSFVKDGTIEYCKDSTHEFSGKKLELPDID